VFALICWFVSRILEVYFNKLLQVEARGCPRGAPEGTVCISFIALTLEGTNPPPPAHPLLSVHLVHSFGLE
jgi:hypothetical protein